MNMGIALHGDSTRECMTVASQVFKMQEQLLKKLHTHPLQALNMSLNTIKSRSWSTNF